MRRTSRRPTRSRASAGCATSGACWWSTSSTWPRSAISAKSRIVCATRCAWTAPASRSAASRASGCSSCRASGCVRRSANPPTRPVRAATGQVTSASVESLALAVLRLVAEEARKDRSAKIIAQLPVDVATYLLNEKRDWIRTIEERDHVQLILIANPALETPNYTLRRVRDDQVSAPENTGVSYTLAAQEQPPEEAALDLFAPRAKPEQPAVLPTMPAAPVPMPPPQPTPPVIVARGPGVITRFLGWLRGKSESTGAAANLTTGTPRQSGQRHDGGRQRGPHGRGRRDDRHRGGRGQGWEQRDNRPQGQQGQQGRQRDDRGRGDHQDQRDQRGSRPQRAGGSDGGRQHDRQGGRGDFRRDERPRQNANQESGQRPDQQRGGPGFRRARRSAGPAGPAPSLPFPQARWSWRRRRRPAGTRPRTRQSWCGSAHRRRAATCRRSPDR